MTADLLSQVISITQDYLGPASERFIKRLINFHLDKEPEELQKKDLPTLAEWIKVSLGLLTEDRTMVDECERRVMELARQKA
jgi:hypothetical protein